jgi:hypothetical protein
MSLLARVVLLPASAGRRHVSLTRGTARGAAQVRPAVACSSSSSRGRRLDCVKVAAIAASSARRRLVCAAAGDVAVSVGSQQEEQEQEVEEQEQEEVEGVVVNTKESSGVMSGELLVLSAVLTNALLDTAAYAAEGYAGIGDPDDEATPLQNAFGFVFTVFCGWYFLRVVKKRGNRAKDFRVANTLPVRAFFCSAPHILIV